MEINIDELIDKVLPEIDNSIMSLQSAIGILYSIKTPTDFSYSSELHNLLGNIEEISIKNQDMFDWLKSTIENFFDAESKNKNVVYQTGASVVNANAGLTKGFLKFGEHIIDFLSILATAKQLQDERDAYNQRLEWAAIRGKDVENFEYTEDSEKLERTMSFVATEYVENAYESFYEDTEVGKWLDDNAVGIFKSDGVGTEIASGIGYTTGIVTTTLSTGGMGAAPFIAGAAGFGKAAEEMWGEMRDYSLEGIEKMYKEGKIPEENYETIKEIRSLTEEEWNKIKERYVRGDISQKDFEQIQQIREMPEEWTTSENFAKGIGYGTLNGAWEGAQWYAGIKLNTLGIGEVSLKYAGLRIGADTVFNALDTPARAAFDSLITGEEYANAFTSRGGWTSVLTDAGVGLISSSLGEFSSTTSIPEYMKLTEEQRAAKKAMKEYFKEYPEFGIGNKEINASFRRNVIYKTDEAFETFLITARGYTEEHAKHVQAVYLKDKKKQVYSPSSKKDTFAHEVDHSLGSAGVMLGDTFSCQRGYNEAMTEKLSLENVGRRDLGNSGYAQNVAYLKRLEEILETKYPDIKKQMAMSYYTDKKDIVQNILLKETGDNGLYYGLMLEMEYSDGYYIKGIDDTAGIKQMCISQYKIEGMLKSLEKTILGETD